MPTIISLGISLKKIAPRQSWRVFAWNNIKNHVIFVVRFYRRKVHKRANLCENWNMQTLCWSIL